MADLEALADRVRALEELQRRCEKRRLALRKTQVSIMMERNFFLGKVRKIEDDGRAHHWGKPMDGEPEDGAGDGAQLLKAIAAVLYDSRSNPVTPRAR